MTIDATKLFTGSCDFVLAAVDPAQFPGETLPEIALIGRSNVGKSSLINALVARKGMARASNTPGRTQQIVFFNLDHHLMLADLPGYGFAKAPLDVKRRWEGLVHTYLRKRTPLKCVCLLIDARHGALANDSEMMERLDRAASIYRVVMTKADKVKPIEAAMVKKQLTELVKTHAAAHPEVLITSAEKNQGIDELRTILAGYAG
jgi:GTP-binding protein